MMSPAETMRRWIENGNFSTKEEKQIGPLERKNMKDFIETAWKEMIMLDSAEKIKQRILEKSKYRREAKSTTNSIIHERKSQTSPNKIIPTTTKNSPRHFQDPYDIHKQVKLRIIERKKVRQRLESQANISRQKLLEKDKEWQLVQEKMLNIERRFLSVEERLHTQRNEKLILGNQTTRNGIFCYDFGIIC